MTDKPDLLIVNGRIIDGAGNPHYEADIAVADGKITAIGSHISPSDANQIIDAEGMIVCPAFMDTHSHDDA